MGEYDLYIQMLDPRFMSKDQSVLTEKNNGQLIHKVNVQFHRVDRYALYRSDEHEIDFLPFFRKGSGSGVPRGLRIFCDYILLAEMRGKMYVLLIEMKSGKTNDAVKQLDASELFMEYICKSAERVKLQNGDISFDKNNVCVRKIIVKKLDAKRHKSVTKGYKMPLECVERTDCMKLVSLDFPILNICVQRV